MKGDEKYMIEWSEEELNMIYSAILNRKIDFQLELKNLRENVLVDDDIDPTIEIELTYLIAKCSEIHSKISDLLTDMHPEVFEDGDVPF